MSWLHHLQHWLAVHTGTVNESGPFYGFWSGFGSDLGEVTLLAGLIAIYRKHVCHSHRCWRLGKHPVDGTPYVVCAKCHPTAGERPTREHIHRAHREAQE